MKKIFLKKSGIIKQVVYINSKSNLFRILIEYNTFKKVFTKLDLSLVKQYLLINDTTVTKKALILIEKALTEKGY